MFDTYHIHTDDRKLLKKVLSNQQLILKHLNELLMANDVLNDRINAGFDALTNLTTQLGTSLNGVKADMEYVKSQIKPGLTEEQAAAAADKVEAIVAALGPIAQGLIDLDASTLIPEPGEGGGEQVPTEEQP